MRRPLVLGIHSGHNAGASLLCGGEIISAISEERLVRSKNISCYPRRSIEACLKFGGVHARELDAVALASFHTFSVEAEEYLSWKRGERESPFPRPAGRRQLAPYGAVGRTVWQTTRWWQNFGRSRQERIPHGVGPWEYTHYQSLGERAQIVNRHLGIDHSRISAVDHHRCHATYAMLASPWRQGALALVADQVGDYASATIWRSGKSGEPIAVARSYALNSLGRIYSAVTGLLGMRPLEDEHKVMGLAPHARFESAAHYVPIFERMLRLQGIEFVEPSASRPCWLTLPASLRGARFDDIAGAVQLFLEKRMCEWVCAAARATNLENVVLSGGVALNVKANRVVGQQNPVRQLFVAPASGDESLAIGAALSRSLELGVDAHAIAPLGVPYFGDVFGQRDVRKACEAFAGDNRFRVVESDDHIGWIARRLADGDLVARYVGRMEFGPRALGNRSILADAADPRIAAKLNRKVKQRDFWMPFAPSVLRERADNYFENPKGHDASAMTIAFRGTVRAETEIPAALHQADLTMRPQTVDERNSSLQQIMQRFESMTGRGALLNTSFNRHREPIVHSPEDAVRAFVECNLDVLDFGWFAIKRRSDIGHA
jgi:carbamoyltransferase